jgi:hypothetical protein
MNYGRPQLAERLAADYALGTMPRRARHRFERVIAGDATVAALVGAWAERLHPLDTAADDETPPARVWRGIERRLGIAGREPVVASWLAALGTWRGLGAVAVAACAAIVLYVAVNPVALPKLAKGFAEKTGLSDLATKAPASAGDVGLSLMNFGISTRERPRWLRAALLLSADGRLNITLQPPAAPPR